MCFLSGSGSHGKSAACSTARDRCPARSASSHLSVDSSKRSNFRSLSSRCNVGAARLSFASILSTWSSHLESTWLTGSPQATSRAVC